jgi:serine/threonine-protein kinase
MASTEKTDLNVAREEERLLHGLISRGLITAEEVKECRQDRDGNGEGGVRDLLKILVKSGYLTPSQAKRTHKNLDAMLQEQIPGYQLLEKLGQGSMGSVYKARQISMDRQVAVKILMPKLAAQPGYVNRFIREARLAAKLSSNNVVQAIDAGTAGSINYFVMEFIEGHSIKDELEQGRVFEEKEAVEIILQVAQALEHAHRRGLVHRDVKPANVIITTENVVKLADLGLARHIEDQELDKVEKGLTIGTPYYIAPEGIRGQTEPDIRGDIYSLGATLYHMVTGQPPFPSKKVSEVLKGHLTGKLTPPDKINSYLSSAIGEVIQFMMMKQRENRYSSPAGVVIDLECLLHGEPPKLAGERGRSKMLADLSKGDVVNPEEEGVSYEAPPGPRYWILGLILLLLLLGGSVAANVIQFLRAK